MNVKLKLYANLANHLPCGATNNEVAVEVANDQTAGGLLNAHNVPRDACHLLLVNGVYSPPASADNVALKEGDTVAVWPAVAGG